MNLRRKLIGAVAGLGILAVAGVAVLLQLPASVLAQIPGAVVITTLLGTEYVSCASCTLSAVWSTATQAAYGRSTGLLYTTTATAGNPTDTSEDTLASYSLPGGTLNVGTKLRIKAAFHAASDGNNKTFKCYFGASVISSGVLTTNNKNGVCEMIVTSVSPTAQIVYATMLVDTTPITSYVNASGSDNTASAVTIKFTGTSGTSAPNEIIMDDFSVERLGN